jgi:UDP-N-acetylmuramyl pentapeptide phosphotransferase/UDP-N-acetylglucosamine-1-phosphate transferase
MIFNTNLFIQSLPLWLLVVIGFSLAMLITYKAIPSIVRVAHLKNLCDDPNDRTSHTQATPTLGGVGIFAGFIVATIIVAGVFFGFELNYIIAGLVIIFFAGIKDDILILDPKKKLAAQVVVAILIAVLADIRITSFYGLFGLYEIPYPVSIAFTVFVFIVIDNGFNLIDGIDGLSAGIGLVATTTFGVWFWLTGNMAYTIMSFAFAGSLVAFYRFNVFSTTHKIFLGDTGSLLIGMVLSILTIHFLQSNLLMEGHYFVESSPAVAIGILIIPLFDTLRVFTLRIAQGKSPFTADRQHLHHLLLQLKFTHKEATMVLLVTNLAFIGVCFALQGIGVIWLTLVTLSLATILSVILKQVVARKAPKIGSSKLIRVSALDILYKEKQIPYAEYKTSKSKVAETVLD